MNRRRKGSLGDIEEEGHDTEDKFHDAEETLEKGLEKRGSAVTLKHANKKSLKQRSSIAVSTDGKSDLLVKERLKEDALPSPLSRRDSLQSVASSLASITKDKRSMFVPTTADGPKQYTVTNTKEKKTWRRFRLQGFLNWAFDAGYGWVILAFLTGFFIMTLAFALVFIWSFTKFPQRCVMNGVSAPPTFLEAYALSWTTFSTVGYGHVSPGQNDESLLEEHSESLCWLTNIICTIESFCGIVYVGFCGAIIFSKVVKVQSQAQVIFSCPMVIRYTSKERSPSDALPFPVLEFRLANTDEHDGGHIVDTTLQAAVSMKSAPRTMKGNLGENIKIGIGDDQDLGSFDRCMMPPPQAPRTVAKAPKKFFRNKNLDTELSQRSPFENPFCEGSRIPSKTYKHLHLINHIHPYLKRSWKVRHRLDLDSPLLTNAVKREIRKNRGEWPTTRTAGSDIIKDFEHIVISCNGISNKSASTVFAQKVYKPTSLCNGFRFADMNVVRGDEIQADLGLINDILEDKGDNSYDSSSDEADMDLENIAL